MATSGDRIGDRTIRQAMDDFLASLNALYTQQTYATPLRHFAAFLTTVGVHVDRDPVAALTVDHAIDFVSWLRHEHFADPDQPAKATLQLYLTAVYRLYRSLLKRGVALGAADIARLEESYRDARNIRGEPRPKDPKLEAVEAVIQAARSVPSVRGDKATDRNRELSRLRDIAVVETLRSTGCRVGELVGMRRGDLDWIAHSALVKGKGTKYRKVYWDETAWRALKVYLQARQDGGDARGLARLPVFCGHGNRSGSTPSPLTTRHVSRTIQSLAEQAGIAEVGVTPHYFRHVFATRALERTDNLALVQDMLGHASPATTRVYARTNEQQRQEGYARVWGEEERNHVGLQTIRDAEGTEEEWEQELEKERETFEAAVPVLDAVRVDLSSPAADRRRSVSGGGVRHSDGAGGGPAAMLELLRSTGCSLEQLVALRVGDLDRSARTVRITSYSGIRRVRLDGQTWDALNAYLENWLGREGASTDPLFRDVDGAPLAAEWAYGMLFEYAAQVGMEKDELHRLL
jgi:site-specific recombinase XerD